MFWLVVLWVWVQASCSKKLNDRTPYKNTKNITKIIKTFFTYGCTFNCVLLGIFGCHKWCLLDIAKRKYEWSLIYNLNKFKFAVSNTHNFVNDYPRILCTTINLKPFSSLCTRALKLVLLNDWIRLSYWISIMYQSYKFWWEHDGQFVHTLTYTSKFTLRSR